MRRERLPEIVSAPTLKLKRQIFERDGRTCQYCGDTEAAVYEVEHVVPQRRWGPNHPANLVIACIRCNRQKRMQIWVPVNFNAITVGYPEWRAEVQRLENPPGDTHISGPNATLGYTLVPGYTGPRYNYWHYASQGIRADGRPLPEWEKRELRAMGYTIPDRPAIAHDAT
jgi:hypothetical protein